LESPIEREYYAREIADEFELSEQVILNDLEKQRTKINVRLKDNLSWNRNTNININNSSQKMLPDYIRAEKALLAHMINYPQIIDRVHTEIGIQFNLTEHQVIVTHLYALYEDKNSIDVSELVDKVNDEQIRGIVSELAITKTNEQLNELEITDYIQLIQT